MKSNTGRTLVAALTMIVMVAGSTAMSSLFVSYRQQWGITSAEIAIVFAVYVGTLLPILVFFGGLSEAEPDTNPRVHQRGTLIAAEDAPTRPRGNRDSDERQITLAGTAIPIADETKHFKLIGTTGTGKSTAIQEILATALARGDRAVIRHPSIPAHTLFLVELIKRVRARRVDHGQSWNSIDQSQLL